MPKKNIIIISGPNLNLLGTREEDIYGSMTMEEIHSKLIDDTINQNLNIKCVQSNSESEIIDLIQNAQNNYDGLIINAGGYTHTSVAIRDALKYFNGYKIEIHMSNIHTREEFREVSMISAVCDGIIVGFGARSYFLALEAIKQI